MTHGEQQETRFLQNPNLLWNELKEIFRYYKEHPMY